MNGYVALAFAIASEICGTTMLKFSDGFTNPIPSIIVVIGFFTAYYLLAKALKTLSLGLAYAIWSGVGTAVTALIGIVLWKDPFTVTTFIGLSLIIGGVILLNSEEAPQIESETTKESTPQATI